MRIIFFGTPGRFSAPPLAALLAAGLDLAAVVVPAPPGSPSPRRLPPLPPAPAGLIPLGAPAPPSILQLAAAAGLPALAIRGMGRPEVAAALAALGADVACVACWPWRLPAPLLGLPRHGFLNLHPSLLPDLRGPEPLFWAFREGRERTGVSVHLMDEGLDTGPIALQGELGLPAGIGGEEAEARAAKLGGELLVEALGRLAAGRLAPRPQPAGGRYLPAPAAGDFALDPAWPARRAFGFMRGTAHWGQPYPVEVGGARLLLAEALAYSDDAGGPPLLIAGGEAQVAFSPGRLTARLARGAA